LTFNRGLGVFASPAAVLFSKLEIIYCVFLAGNNFVNALVR